MVKKLEEVLCWDDFKEINRKLNNFSRFDLSNFCVHLLVTYGKHRSVELETKKTLDNEFAESFEGSRNGNKNYQILNNGDRTKVLRRAFQMRNEHISKNRYFLSKIYGDVGWVYAAGNWLLAYGDDFYKDVEDGLKSKGIIFRFIGNEKSIFLECYNGSKKRDYCEITTHNCLDPEEILAEKDIIVENFKKPEFFPFCEKIRHLFENYEKMHCIMLKGKSKPLTQDCHYS